jgi:hypothetical protein
MFLAFFFMFVASGSVWHLVWQVTLFFLFILVTYSSSARIQKRAISPFLVVVKDL